MVKYPKVLIIGETFHFNSGGGITLTNLFTGWPKEKIAIVSWPNSIRKTNFNLISQYYQLGVLEEKPVFPLSLFTKKHPSGTNIRLGRNKSISSVAGEKSIKGDALIKKVGYFLLNKSGLSFKLLRVKLSKELLNWIDGYKPDIIYTQLSSLSLINLITDLVSCRHYKLVIHIMDDWPSTINQSLIVHKYFEKLINERFVNLINRASLLLSISEGMSKEYFERYKRDFFPFHNPVDISKWLPYQKRDYNINGKEFKILYTGRIGTANSGTILSFISAIKDLVIGPVNVILDIYTPDYYSHRSKKYSDNIHFYRPVPFNEMPKLLSEYDLLLLPLDFSKKGALFSRLSMPTKASEYMISGVPILIVASEQSALVQHAKENEWAFCVNVNKADEIIFVIKSIMNSVKLRSYYANNAIKYAENNFNSEIVKSRFQNLLFQI